MKKNEIDNIIANALRSEFDRAYCEKDIRKQINICKVCIKLNYKELAKEMIKELL